MKAVVFLISATMLMVGVRGDCLADLQQCLLSTRTTAQQHINNYNFEQACPALRAERNCYTVENKPECLNYTSHLNSLKRISDHYLQMLCNADDTPNACVLGLQGCYRKYNYESATTDIASLCRAVNNARVCLNTLNCPAEVNEMSASFRDSISHRVTESQCLAADPLASQCRRDASGCGVPIEESMQAAIKNYNYVSLCGLQVELGRCFQGILNDPNCAAEKATLETQIAAINSIYSQYCTPQHEPVDCLKTLQSCTSKNTEVTNIANYARDKLLQCQGSSDFNTCLEKVQGLTCSGNITAVVRSISNRLIVDAQAVQINNTCANVLTPCTASPGRCLVDDLLGMKQNEDAANFNTVCRYAQQLQICLNIPASAGCENNQYVLFEKVWVANYTARICDPTHSGRAVECLQQFQDCALPMINAQQHYSGDALYCKAEDTFLACFNGIVCPTADLTERITIGREKVRIQDAQCQRQFPSGSASVLVSSLLCIILPVVTMLKMS